MIQILVNMHPVQLLQPITDPIVSITITSFGQTPVPAQAVNPIVAWLYDLTQRAEKTVVFNGTIIAKEDIKDIVNP